MDFPKGLEEIGELAFDKCTLLLAIVIPQFVRAVPWWAFQDCEQLTSVVLPKGLEEIGESAFYSCRSLVAIVIPPLVKRIP